MRISSWSYILLISFCVSVMPAIAQTSIMTNSWVETKSAGRGTVVIYWYESRPFIYQEAGVMKGIEPDLIDRFKKYLSDHYNVALNVVWIEAKSFGDTYSILKQETRPGILGASAFSITPEREKEVGFGAPYMSDISVLITSKDIPIVQNQEQFNEVFSKLTAITIQETTYEQDIKRLKKEGNLGFSIRYIPSSQNILRVVEAQDSAFGFIDLPVYMMMFKSDPSINVNRQNLFPVKRKGYSIIYPLGSDWGNPLVEYLTSEKFKREFGDIIARYIDRELYHFVENLAIQSNDNMVVLLTKEKEIQYKDLLGKEEQIEKETRTRNFLITLSAVIFLFLLVIIFLYRKRSQQKEKIESQRESIRLKNDQLLRRNEQLIALDEEKNNLIKILAHDLRTPINHVQGLAQVFLLTNPSLPEDQRMMIQGIMDASTRLNKMISNILDIDSIEQNRVRLFMEEVSIGPLLDQVIRTFDKEAANKNIRLSSSLNGVEYRVNGDSLFLMQVMENLVSNAIKFSEKGKEVSVSLTAVDGKIRVSVKDSGPGLTEEDQKLLFKKFQRLSARPTNGEISTGLGLSIVKKYVELMGGSVWCESEPGKGANFIVEFSRAG